MRQLLQFVPLTLSLIATGCHFDDSALRAPPVVIPGQGSETFVPADDGAPIEVFCGPAGSVVIFISIRIFGLDPGDPEAPFGDPANPITTVTVASGDYSRVRESSFPYTGVEDDPTLFELVGFVVGPLDYQLRCTFDGAQFVVTSEVADAFGVSASETRYWVGTVSSFCAC